MNKEISILGCGKLGLPLSINLINKGFEISGSTTSSDKIKLLENKGIKPYLINIEQLTDNISEFLMSEILIINIPLRNIEAFINLIQLIEKSNVRKVIYISTTSVYIEQNKIVEENSPKNLDSPYLKIENLFSSNQNFKTTIIRFAGLISQNRRPENFFPDGKIIPNKSGFVNMIHHDDCINIIEKIIEKGIWNQVFNACIDYHPTREEYYTKVKQKAGRQLPAFSDDSDAKYKIISSTKLIEMLDYDFILKTCYL